MNVNRGLILLLVLAAQSISAKQVAIPVAQVGDAELNAVLPNEKVLLGLLLANAIHIIWALAKSMWDAREKHNDKSGEKLEEMYKMVLEMKGKVDNLPDEKVILDRLERHIELMVYRAVRNERRSP